LRASSIVPIRGRRRVSPALRLTAAQEAAVLYSASLRLYKRRPRQRRGRAGGDGRGGAPDMIGRKRRSGMRLLRRRGIRYRSVNWCGCRVPGHEARRGAIEPAAESLDSSRCVRNLRADCSDPFCLHAGLHLAGCRPARDGWQHVLRLPQHPAMSQLRQPPYRRRNGIGTAVSQVRNANLGPPARPLERKAVSR
jgi:hypothetical protein